MDFEGLGPGIRAPGPGPALQAVFRNHLLDPFLNFGLKTVSGSKHANAMILLVLLCMEFQIVPKLLRRGLSMECFPFGPGAKGPGLWAQC